jgi:hypothetical protein
MFIDFNVYTRENIDITALKTHIMTYIDSVSGSMEMLSISDLQSHLSSLGISITISPTIKSRLFLSTETYNDFDSVFPLSMKDISIPVEFNPDMITERTIKIFLGEVNVTKE